MTEQRMYVILDCMCYLLCHKGKRKRGISKKKQRKECVYQRSVHRPVSADTDRQLEFGSEVKDLLCFLHMWRTRHRPRRKHVTCPSPPSLFTSAEQTGVISLELCRALSTHTMQSLRTLLFLSCSRQPTCDISIYHSACIQNRSCLLF